VWRKLSNTVEPQDAGGIGAFVTPNMAGMRAAIDAPQTREPLATRKYLIKSTIILAPSGIH
jgi:hypothetical protein